MNKEKAPLCEIYKDITRGDILRVKKVSKSSLIVENLSIDNEFRKEFKIDKVELAKKNFSLIRRKSVELIRILEDLDENN
jgi:hypothetical protein